MWLCKRDLSKECEGKYRNCTDCVLDKIRTEIAEEHNDCMVTEHYDAAYGLELALGIIDKYKGESENK